MFFGPATDILIRISLRHRSSATVLCALHHQMETTTSLKANVKCDISNRMTFTARSGDQRLRRVPYCWSELTHYRHHWVANVFMVGILSKFRFYVWKIQHLSMPEITHGACLRLLNATVPKFSRFRLVTNMPFSLTRNDRFGSNRDMRWIFWPRL